MLGASYVFYSAANPMFCMLLAGITLGERPSPESTRSAGRRRRRAYRPSPAHLRIAAAYILAIVA